MGELRIVQVIPSLVRGGAEAFALDLAEAQLAAGHDVHLIRLRPDDALIGRASPALRERCLLVEKRGRIDPTVVPRLRAELVRLSPDVVHTHLFTALAWGAVAAKLAGVPRVFYTEHAAHPDDERWTPWVRRPLGRLLHGVVGCSAAAVAAVERAGWATHLPICQIDNGIRVAGRPRAAFPAGPLHIGTVGRLVPIKGQRHLIEAVAKVRRAGVDVRLTIVGEGPLEHELAAQVAAAGLADVVSLPGPTDRVADVLATFDLFALPSISEAMPITLLEAAAAGLPLLVTTGGGGPTLLQAGAGGWAVAPADSSALAEPITLAASMSRDALSALGAASYDVVAASFSIERTQARYEALYRG